MAQLSDKELSRKNLGWLVFLNVKLLPYLFMGLILDVILMEVAPPIIFKIFNIIYVPFFIFMVLIDTVGYAISFFFYMMDDFMQTFFKD